MAHFFPSVSGSTFSWRVAHNFLDNRSKIYNQTENTRQLYPQTTTIFKNSDDETMFCSRLYDLFTEHEFIEFHTSKAEVSEKMNVEQYQISLQNMEQLINRLAWYPSPGGMQLINRRPTDTIIALYISAFAANRNFCLVTTLIDQTRSNQIFCLKQCVY